MQDNVSETSMATYPSLDRAVETSGRLDVKKSLLDKVPGAFL